MNYYAQVLADNLGLDPSTLVLNKYDQHEVETVDGDRYWVGTEAEARQHIKDYCLELFDEMGLDAYSKWFQDWIVDNCISNYSTDLADLFQSIRDESTEEEEVLLDEYDDDRVNFLVNVYGLFDSAKQLVKEYPGIVDKNKLFDELESQDGLEQLIGVDEIKELPDDLVYWQYD